jgi:menaquinone-dependent protoporphyrinogen oxidase
MSPRFLVLYGTTEGQTAKIAAAIARTLRHQGAIVDLVNAASRTADPKPEDYAAVVVAASVHAGGYQRAVRRWARAHAGGLAMRPAAFVSVCLGVLERNPETDRALSRIAQRFFAVTGWTPTVVKIVAGALPYTHYNWLKRWLMRRIVAKAHGDTDTTRDYEYTDWNDLREFTIGFCRRAEAGDSVRVAV